MFKKCEKNLFSLQKTNVSADSVERPSEFFVREIGPCRSTLLVAVLTREQVSVRHLQNQVDDVRDSTECIAAMVLEELMN